MAAIQALYAEGIDVTVTDTNWVDIASISAGSFTAGAKYLIIANAIIRTTSGVDNALVRLVHGTTPTVFTDGELQYELTTGNVQEHCASWMYVYTQPGTTELIKIQAASTTTSDVFVELGQVFALNLDEYGSSGTDYHYNEVTADYTTTITTTSQATVTFTPNGTDSWIIIGAFAQQPGSTSANYKAELHDSVAGILTSLDIEGEDIVVSQEENRGHIMMAVVTPTNASHTFSTRFLHETTAGIVWSSRIIALNLNKFKQHAFSRDASQDAPAATPSWTTTRTIAPTPTSTGDWLVWGYYVNHIAATTNDTATRLQINASGGGLASNPNYGDSAPGIDGWDNTDEIPFNMFKMLSLSSGGARTINWDVQAVVGTTQRAQDRTLVAFALETSATQVDTAFTAAASFQATVSTNFTAAASFQGQIDTNFAAAASFATLVDIDFTAAASFTTLINNEFTAAASFQKWEVTFTAAASFQGQADKTFTAAVSFRDATPVATSFTAAVSFFLGIENNTIFYPYPENTSVSYEIRLATSAGMYIDIMDGFTNLDYTLITNDIGSLVIELPSNYPVNHLVKDSRIEVWRAVGYNAPKLEGNTQFLIQGRERSVSDNGDRLLRVTGLSLNHILKRRIAAYRANELTYIDLAGEADDVMKEVVRTNFSVTAADTDRRISDEYFDVDANESLAPAVWKAFPHENILDVLKALADNSFQLGTPLFFDVVVSKSPKEHIFRTWITSRGVDRRFGHASSRLLLGHQYGSIGAYTVTEDWSNEIGYVYAAGPGEEDVRDIQPASDSTIINKSIYGRSEMWVDSQDSDTSDHLVSVAKATLAANRTKKIFQGRILNTNNSIYGIHWGWGDYVTAEVESERFDSHVSSVHITVTAPDGKETVDAGLRSS